jgi:hypothetical protein
MSLQIIFFNNLFYAEQSDQCSSDGLACINSLLFFFVP